MRLQRQGGEINETFVDTRGDHRGNVQHRARGLAMIVPVLNRADGSAIRH
ncbi:MAG: hypothetical protein JWP89_6201 [Schlesneria sp.]|nr:hypothetical protein [Schlesneria sp.]